MHNTEEQFSPPIAMTERNTSTMPTDDHDDHDDREEFREYVREIFANVEPRPPRDVVPTPGLTRQALERQSAAYLKPCTGTIPGEVLTDPDGNLIGMTEAREFTAISCGTVISQAEADRLGIAPGELPGVTIIENY